MTEEEHTGLRERRRSQTLREISDAALALFERQGVAATTVDEIARDAGVSPRTFFRYFSTKELAVFIDDELAERALEQALDKIEEGTESVPHLLESLWVELIAEFDRDEAARTRFLRVRQLIDREPALLAVALRRDSERAHWMAERIANAPGGDGDVFSALSALELLGTAARLTYGEWARRADQGRADSIAEIYAHARSVLLQTAITLQR